jgi:hypothetical protein
VCVVAVGQVVKGHSSRSTDALCHVLPSHLEVDTSCVAPFLLMNIEECPDLSLLEKSSWLVWGHDYKDFSEEYSIKETILANDLKCTLQSNEKRKVYCFLYFLNLQLKNVWSYY